MTRAWSLTISKHPSRISSGWKAAMKTSPVLSTSEFRWFCIASTRNQAIHSAFLKFFHFHPGNSFCHKCVSSQASEWGQGIKATLPVASPLYAQDMSMTPTATSADSSSCCAYIDTAPLMPERSRADRVPAFEKGLSALFRLFSRTSLGVPDTVVVTITSNSSRERRLLLECMSTERTCALPVRNREEGDMSEWGRMCALCS